MDDIPEIEQEEWEILGSYLRIKFRWDEVIHEIYNIYLKRARPFVQKQQWQDAFRTVYHCPDHGVKYAIQEYIYKERKEYEKKNGICD